MVDVVLRGGRSFKGLGVYLVEGPRGKQRPAHAVGETLYFNLPVVRDPRHAFGIMAATARDANALKQLAGIPSGGRRGEKPVYHLVLSWSREESVTDEQVRDAVEEALLELGLEDHQAVAIVHHDTGHVHVHVMVNRVSPEDGRFAGMGRDRLKLSRWARQWEQRTFGRTFCRRPERDEHLRVVRSTCNRPGKYPIRYRKRRRPVRDEHWREEWRRLLSRQRGELDAAKQAGGDVAALEKQQRTERAELSLELLRREEQRQPEDTNRVDPEPAATGAKSGHDGASGTTVAATAQLPDNPARVNGVTASAQRSPEFEAPKTLSGLAEETLAVPIPQPAHAPKAERVEATESEQQNEAGGDGAALEKQRQTARVKLARELSRIEQQRRTEVPRVDPREAVIGATSGHDRTLDTANAAQTRAPDGPARVSKVSEPTQGSSEFEAPKPPSGPADETRPVPIPTPVHAPKVERVEAVAIDQPNAATANKAPTPQAVQRRAAQQTPEPAVPVRTPGKSADRGPLRGRSGVSVGQRHEQESRSASPVAPPLRTRRDADSRPPEELAEQPRAKEQRPAADVSAPAGRKTGGAVQRMHDRPIEAPGRAMKKGPDRTESISTAAGPVRNDGPGAAASSIPAGLPTPPAAANETRAAPIAAAARARAVSGGKATGTGQTDATAAGAVHARPAAQQRTPAQARQSSGSHAPPAKSAGRVPQDGKRGRVDGGHPPTSTSTSPKGAPATPAETRRDDVHPSAFCLKDYGSQPAAAVNLVAAVIGIDIMRSRSKRPRRGIFGNIVHVPTASTPDAQHAADLWGCALKAPPLDGLDEGQRIVAAAAVAQSLADALGTRKTFDAGRPQLQWPPPAAAPLRDIIRRAVEWFVEQLRHLFEGRRKERDRKMAAFRAGLRRYAAGGTMDDLARPLAGPAMPMSTARRHPGRTSADRVPGTTTPPANRELVGKPGTALPKSHGAGPRTPSAAVSRRIPARSNTEASPSAASGHTADRQRIVSTSSRAAPSTSLTAPAGTPVRARPAPEVQVPSIGQVPPDGVRLENGAAGNAKPRTSHAADSVPPAQAELPVRPDTPVRGSPGGRAVKMIARQLAARIEAECRVRYGETLKLTTGTLRSVRKTAGEDVDKTIVIDALIERAESSGDGPERDRAEREYLEHRPEVVKARKEFHEPEPEPSAGSWWSRWVGGESEPPRTARPAPDPAALLASARKRYEQEIVEIIGNVVSEVRENLETLRTPPPATSRAEQDKEVADRARTNTGPRPQATRTVAANEPARPPQSR